MPSRRAVALIFAFWLATTGYVAYRDLWPRYFASGPPSVAIDLADEAAQHVPVRWQVKWNGKVVGRLKTQMAYVEADDTFWFTSQYKDLRKEFMGLTVFVPEFTTAVRVTREGHLREQTAEGTFNVELNKLIVGTGAGKLVGRVANGQLVAKFEGACEIVGLPKKSVTREFDPVPVPAGQPLNPLQPVNRLVGIRPGREWVVHESNPLSDVVQSVAGEFGVPPQKKEDPLVGRVMDEPRDLDWNDERTACWVIEYRRSGELQVRTWVRAADGRVLKQEAYNKGETLSIEREE